MYATLVTAGFVGVLSVTGCSGDPLGTVHGKVTYKGEPAPVGATIAFVSASGAAGSGNIGADGTYSVTASLPVGIYTVIISPPANVLSPAEAMRASQPGGVTDKYPNIPPKYRAAATSNSSLEIKPGKNEYNLNMTD